MNKSFDDYNEEDINFETKEDIDEVTGAIDSQLWTKLEKVGKKISFAKDLLALYHYLIDKNVSWHRKAIVAGALIYFIVPIDTIPDLVPLFGYMDDLGVIAATLKFLGSELIPYYDS
ncbi:MAG: DUF1232 domain-containing protein [Bacteroidetes bacterium]|nr:DUF1232 domain-containing protein [Bacteroidota bacterium]MBU1116888.1 DUF1232 domain-containing protein [Bacteroidota bacterium]MBU1797434.1 DUF1232 domain-containing protein [Bacteroidota bacterium]